MLSKEKFLEYRDKGLNQSQIAKLEGVSRGYVSQIVKKYELQLEYRVAAICEWCGKEFIKQRKQTRKHCSHACYLAKLSNEQSLYNRTTRSEQRKHQRRAWNLFEKATGISKQIQWSMHHIDENFMNNTLDNLFVFYTHSKHRAFHHGSITMSAEHGFTAYATLRPQ